MFTKKIIFHQKVEDLISLQQVSEPELKNLRSFENLSSTEMLDLFDAEFKTDQPHDFLSEVQGSLSLDSYSSQASQENGPTLAQRRSYVTQFRNRRRRRGQRSALQLACGSKYFTKNFLQQGKNSHMLYLERIKGADFIQTKEFLRKFKEKGTPSKQDYLILYKIQELRQVWRDFFKKRVMYRQLMLSRTEKLYKLIYAKFQFRFQEAFETGEFKNIAQ